MKERLDRFLSGHTLSDEEYTMCMLTITISGFEYTPHRNGEAKKLTNQLRVYNTVLERSSKAPIDRHNPLFITLVS